jgi:hypothetical protein
MRTCVLTQRQSLSSGKKNYEFAEDGNKYCCIGAHPGRAERGVQSGLYRLNHGLSSKEWDLMHNVLKRAENAFDRYMETNNTSPVQGPMSITKQWGHHHLHQTKNMHVIIMDSVLELMFT